MNESNQKLLDMLQNQVQIRDETIESLKRENNKLMVITKDIKKKYRNIALILSGLLIILSSIDLLQIIYN